MSSDPKNSKRQRTSSPQPPSTLMNSRNAAEQQTSNAQAPPMRSPELLERIRAESRNERKIQNARQQYEMRMKQLLAELESLERMLNILERKHVLLKQQFHSEISILRQSNKSNHFPSAVTPPFTLEAPNHQRHGLSAPPLMSSLAIQVPFPSALHTLSQSFPQSRLQRRRPPSSMHNNSELSPLVTTRTAEVNASSSFPTSFHLPSLPQADPCSIEPRPTPPTTSAGSQDNPKAFSGGPPLLASHGALHAPSLRSLPNAFTTPSQNPRDRPNNQRNMQIKENQPFQKQPSIAKPPSSSWNQNAMASSSQGRAVMEQSGTREPSDASHRTCPDKDWSFTFEKFPLDSKPEFYLNLQQTLPHESVVSCVRYSWNGEQLATGSRRCTNVFDANSGQHLFAFADEDSPRPMRNHGPQSSSNAEDNNNGGEYVRSVCFSPDGKLLVTGSDDHVLHVWDMQSRRLNHRIEETANVFSVDISSTSKFIVSASGEEFAKLWNLKTGTLLSTLHDHDHRSDKNFCVAVSPDVNYIATGTSNGIVKIWDARTSRRIRVLKAHKDSVFSVAFSPCSRMLLSGSLDTTVKLWDVTHRQGVSHHSRHSYSGHEDFVLSVAFSPNGALFLSSSKDCTVHFRDSRKPHIPVVLRGHKESVLSIAHNPKSRAVASGSGDCRVRTWSY